MFLGVPRLRPLTSRDLSSKCDPGLVNESEQAGPKPLGAPKCFALLPREPWTRLRHSSPFASREKQASVSTSSPLSRHSSAIRSLGEAEVTAARRRSAVAAVPSLA